MSRQRLRWVTHGWMMTPIVTLEKWGDSNQIRSLSVPCPYQRRRLPSNLPLHVSTSRCSCRALHSVYFRLAWRKQSLLQLRNARRKSHSLQRLAAKIGRLCRFVPTIHLASIRVGTWAEMRFDWSLSMFVEPPRCNRKDDTGPMICETTSHAPTCRRTN